MSAHVLEELEEQQRREFRRLLWVSLAAHLGLAAVLFLAPMPEPSPLPAVVTVDLMARLPSARPAAQPKAPAPKAAETPPAPAPPPPPPPPKKVVLPEKPQPVSKKPKKAPARPKPKPQPRRRPDPVNYEDALAQLREEMGEDTPPEPPEGSAEDPELTPAPSSSEGVRVSPEVAAWMKRAEIHVRRSWVTPQEFLDRRLQTRLRVTLGASGEVLGQPEITGPSGDPFYDDNVVRALLRASPLPPPPEAGDWPFVFTPEDDS